MKFLKRFDSSNKFNINSYVSHKRRIPIIYIIEDMYFAKNLIWVYKIKNIDTDKHEWVSENSLRNLTKDEKIIIDIKKYNI